VLRVRRDPDADDVVAHPQVGSPEDTHTPATLTPDSVLEAIDHLADGYFEMDAEYRYRRVNPAGLRITGKTREEMLGKHVLEVFPEITNAAIHHTTMRVMETGEAASVETYYAPFKRWYVNSIYPITGGIALVTRDINDQKVLEHNLAFLAEASKILSSSLDTQQTLRAVAQIAVPRIADWCTIDVLTAPRTVELLAVAHVDPEKVQWAQELRQRDPVDLERPGGLAKVLLTGKPEFYPQITDEMLVATARDARTLALARSLGFTSAMIVPLVVQDATIGAITFVATDSGRHYTPADLTMAQELASRAALAIENSRLYGASQRAVALRDDFIAAASHELRTPVTSLKVYTEVMLKQATKRRDETAMRSLQVMNNQIDRLSTLIVDLLDVAKIESGTLELRQEAFDLRRLVDEIVDGMQATLTTHRLEVRGAATLDVFGDRDRIGQVLTNLLSNAVKYSPQADRVLVRLAGDMDHVTLEVEDFGIGIAREHMPHLFDRFYRVSAPDEKTFPGLGMGLYIVQEIVYRHGGDLQVESTAGRGSCFRVRLPAAGRPARPSEAAGTETA
jgi:PAS domain S-box-containing protein